MKRSRNFAWVFQEIAMWICLVVPGGVLKMILARVFWIFCLGSDPMHGMEILVTFLLRGGDFGRCLLGDLLG